MSTEEPVTRVVAAKVREASKEKRGEKELWGLKLKVPFSQYAIPTSMPLASASEVFKGETYMVKLRRGRLVKDEYDGSKDFHYFWDVEEWNTAAPLTPAASSNGNQDEYRRSKTEMRWTEALHLATRVNGPETVNNEHVRIYLRDWAEWFYEQLARPPGVDQQPTESDESSEDYCQMHQVPFDQRSTNSGARFHNFGDQYCVEGKGLIVKEKQEAKA